MTLQINAPLSDAPSPTYPPWQLDQSAQSGNHGDPLQTYITRPGHDPDNLVSSFDRLAPHHPFRIPLFSVQSQFNVAECQLIYNSYSIEIPKLISSIPSAAGASDVESASASG